MSAVPTATPSADTTPLAWRTWTATRPAPDSSARLAAQPSAARLAAVSSTPTTIKLAIPTSSSRAVGGRSNHLVDPKHAIVYLSDYKSKPTWSAKEHLDRHGHPRRRRCPHRQARLPGNDRR